VKGGRDHLAYFPEKGLTDFSLTAGKILQMEIGGLKLELRYDYKLHCMRYIDDVEKLK
jgi:hypothetical protein